MHSPKIKNGFLQEPKHIELNGRLYHLEDTLKHASQNHYQIKEIQAKGFVAVVTKSLFTQLVGKKVYISFNDLPDYLL